MNYTKKLDDLKYYMEYFIEGLLWRKEYSMKVVSFEDFCSYKNVITHDIGEGWDNRGKIKGVHGFEFDMSYASRTWTVNAVESLQHYKEHGLKIK